MRLAMDESDRYLLIDEGVLYDMLTQLDEIAEAQEAGDVKRVEYLKLQISSVLRMWLDGIERVN